MTTFAPEVVRARFDWADCSELDAIAKERGSTRGEVVSGIVAGALRAEVADDLLDLGRESPDQPVSNPQEVPT